jgi:hypothetical protein
MGAGSPGHEGDQAGHLTPFDMTGHHRAHPRDPAVRWPGPHRLLRVHQVCGAETLGFGPGWKRRSLLSRVALARFGGVG